MIRGIFKKSKRKIITSVLLTCIVFTSAGMFSTTARATDSNPQLEDSLIKAYCVYYEGHKIGIVERQEDIEAMAENIRQDFETQFDMKTMVEHDIDFDEILVDNKYLSEMDSLEKVLLANAEPKVECTLLEIDGNLVGTLRDQSEAQAILDSVTKPYEKACQKAGGRLEKVDFEEEITMPTSYLEHAELEDPETVLARCTESQEEKQTYTVEKGDNVWIIADKNNITLDELLDANVPLKQSDILQIDQKLNLNLPKMPINVLTVEAIDYTEAIDFETETKETDSLYTDQTKVFQEGKKGKLKVEAKVHKRNGIEEDREVISETVVEKPVKEIILKGTKKRASKSSSRGGSSSGGGSGSMRWPASGRISSGFGQRWGRLHAGIDIAAGTGTPIYAADSGTVSYSTFNNGGYGNLVKINHGSGIVTYYAHMSSRAVGKGASVKKGQLIGYVGSTGNSTGPHLHFEVRVNGSPRNPMNYLN